MTLPSKEMTLQDLANNARPSYRTVEQMVHEVIREAILTAIYEPGQRLPQDHIAESIGVSRIPVRAALRQLAAEGFVVFEPHKGATVKALTGEEIAEIYDLRALLEGHALKAVAEKIVETQLDELDELAAEMDAAEDPEAWDDARRAFYRRLYEIADRPHTQELIDKLRVDVGRYWRLRRVSEDHADGHEIIVQALRNGRPDDAAEWLTTHFTELAQKLQSVAAT